MPKSTPSPSRSAIAIGVDNTTSAITVAGSIDTTGDTFIQSNAVNMLNLFANAGGNAGARGRDCRRRRQFDFIRRRRPDRRT